jgi:hypothetical protein
MCAASNQKSPVSTTPSTASNKPMPKWMKMKLQNKSSAGKTVKPTVQKSSSSAQKPSEGTREEKRKRWAKKAVPKQKPVAVRKGPEKEYLCECHSEPARKPKAGTKVASTDPETGRPAKKEKATGLGKWRCSTTGKITKVKPRMPQPKVVPTGAVVGADPSRGTGVTIASA